MEGQISHLPYHVACPFPARKKETFEKLHGKSGSLISDGQKFLPKVLGREPSDLLCTKASSFKPLRDPSSVRSLKFYLSLSLVHQW